MSYYTRVLDQPRPVVHGPATPVLFYVCAWCQRVTGVAVCAESSAGHTSHGICQVCFDMVLEGLRR